MGTPMTKLARVGAKLLVATLILSETAFAAPPVPLPEGWTFDGKIYHGYNRHENNERGWRRKGKKIEQKIHPWHVSQWLVENDTLYTNIPTGKQYNITLPNHYAPKGIYDENGKYYLVPDDGSTKQNPAKSKTTSNQNVSDHTRKRRTTMSTRPSSSRSRARTSSSVGFTPSRKIGPRETEAVNKAIEDRKAGLLNLSKEHKRQKKHIINEFEKREADQRMREMKKCEKSKRCPTSCTVRNPCCRCKYVRDTWLNRLDAALDDLET